MIFVVIPVHNRFALTRRCLLSLSRQDFTELQVVIVDAGSEDGTAARLATEFPDVTVVTGSEDWWWTAATNAGVRHVLRIAKGDDYVLTLNNDTELQHQCLSVLMKAARSHPRSLLGAVMIDDRDGSEVDAGLQIANWYTAAFRAADVHTGPDRAPFRRVDVLPGRGTLVPVEAYRVAGLYDERRLPHYGADYEFSWRSKQLGFDLLVCSEAKLDGVVEATGLHGTGAQSARDIALSLWSIRSANSLRYRWTYARLVCPPRALPFYIASDTLRVVGGTLRDAVRAKSRRAQA